MRDKWGCFNTAFYKCRFMEGYRIEKKLKNLNLHLKKYENSFMGILYKQNKDIGRNNCNKSSRYSGKRVKILKWHFGKKWMKGVQQWLQRII